MRGFPARGPCSRPGPQRSPQHSPTNSSNFPHPKRGASGARPKFPLPSVQAPRLSHPQEAREKADAKLSKCNPEIFPCAIKHGVAPAMAADPRGPFWGQIPGEVADGNQMTKDEAKLVGCSFKSIPADCRQAIEYYTQCTISVSMFHGI